MDAHSYREEARNKWVAEMFGVRDVYRDDVDFVDEDDEEGKTLGYIKRRDDGAEQLHRYADASVMAVVPLHLRLGL